MCVCDSIPIHTACVRNESPSEGAAVSIKSWNTFSYYIFTHVWMTFIISWSFSYQAPLLWSQLSDQVQQADALFTFKPIRLKLSLWIKLLVGAGSGDAELSSSYAAEDRLLLRDLHWHTKLCSLPLTVVLCPLCLSLYFSADVLSLRAAEVKCSYLPNQPAQSLVCFFLMFFLLPTVEGGGGGCCFFYSAHYK